MFDKKSLQTVKLFLLFGLLLLSRLGMAQTLTITNGIQSYTSLANTTVTMTGHAELHITATNNPISGCIINLNSPDAWFFLDNIQPAAVTASYLGQIRVSGAAAVAGGNVRVVEYAMGSVVIPQASTFQPLTLYSGSQFTGAAMPLNLYTYYNASNLGGMYNGIGSFKLKRGYMATFGQQPDGSGFSQLYVAQDGDLEVGVMPGSLNGNVAFVRVFDWRWTSKKGFAGGPDLQVNPYWYYDWDNQSTSTPNVEYIPMRHDAYWDSYANINSNLNTTAALGFNEPDSSSQANMTVAAAIAQWPQLMASGLRLGSPAPTDGGESWLYSFIDQADALHYRVDYVALHFYQCGYTAAQWYNWLWAIHARTHRPLWITEFNNGATWTSCAVPTLQQNAQTISDFITMLDAAPFVERYAIYNWVGDTRAMVDTNGVLTPAGVVYLNESSPKSYLQEFPCGTGTEAEYLFNGDARDATGSGNHGLQAGSPTFVAGQSGQAVQLDGVHDYIQVPSNVGHGSNFTFGAWIKWNGGATGQRIFDFGADTLQYMYLTPDSSGSTLYFGITTNGTEQSIQTTALTPGTWTHVAVTINGNTGKLFVNGALAAVNNNLAYNPAQLPVKYCCLGKSQYYNDYFGGQLDQVFFAGYALTDAQVATLASATPPQFNGDPLVKSTAYLNQLYGDSIAANASNAGGGALTFRKLAGPAWLNVAANGALSGVPDVYSLGTNRFTVEVVNASGLAAVTRLGITVLSLGPQPANPGFEQPVTPNFIYNPNGGAWTFSPNAGGNGSGVATNGSDFTWGNVAAPEGGQVAFLQGTGAISQAISGFAVGTTYTINFLASQRQNNGTTPGNTFNLQMDGRTIGSFAPANSTNYLAYATNFTATATTHTLAFVGTDLNGGDNTAFLDNVRIVAAAGPPAAPTALFATAGNTVVNLSWVQSTSAGITLNKIYRAAGSAGPYALLAVVSPTTTYADTAVANGTTYFYVVTAVNVNGESAYSSYSGATPQGPPLAPTGVVATPANTQISLSWTAAATATSYNVKRASVSGGPYTTIASPTSTGYTDTGLVNGTTNFYVVSAVNGLGESPNSAEVSAVPAIIPGNYGFETPVTSTYIYNPSGGSWTFSNGTGSGSGVTANNSAFTAANPVAPQGVQVAFLQTTGTIAQAISGFVPGATYTVTFAAAQRGQYQNGGQSWNVTIDGTVIGSFNPGASATSYVDYSASFVATAATHTLGFVGTDLVGGDNTVFIDNVRITDPPAQKPAAPTGLTATGGVGLVRLGWTASPQATSYHVKRATTSGGPYTSIATNTTSLVYTNTGLGNGIFYYYVVSAANSAGESSNSAETNAMTCLLPANNGFETPVTATYLYNPAGGSWTFTAQAGSNGSGIATNKSAFTAGNPVAPQGGQVAFLQATSTVSQAVSGFISARHYTVNFVAAQRGNKSPAQSGQTWDVRINGTAIGSFAPAQTATNYVSYSAGFTAAAATNTVAFVGTDTKGGDNTVFIDNVQITSP